MDDRTVLEVLREYIVTELLEGQGEDFNFETPLLEWGLLNSMEIARLLVVIRQRFGVIVDAREVTPAHFRTLNAVKDLIMSHG